MTAPGTPISADAPAPTGSNPAAPGAPGALQPPVVAVVVAHDPGEWFESTLRSIRDQTYANLSLLVIDAGSEQPLASRVAAVVPDAHERRLETNPGFGPACNEVLHAVRGAAFYLICHDDIALEPDAVRIMVEEAFRANAGIVGPKVVRWDDPERLLALGMGVDRFGQPSPTVERGELDQAQHDSLREVFAIPGAATLVRADLFAALGGFDPGIDFHGEDLDLCWRAHVVGARVVVAPMARVAHLEALGLRRPVDDRRRRQLRHRLRSLRICTTRWRRWAILVQAAVLTVLEGVYALAGGRLRHIADLVGAWSWNLRRGGEIRRRRKELAAVRAVPESQIRALQSSGSARLRSFLARKLAGGEENLVGRGASGRVTQRLRAGTTRATVAAWGLAALVLLLGSRGLIGSTLPAVGDFVAFPAGPGALAEAWFSTERPVGLGASGPAPPGLGLFWFASVFSFGATGLARTALILAALPVGALGAWRLARPIASRRARIAALLVFVANPLTYNALAQGRWPGLVLCALFPWMLLQLAKASRLDPYGSDRPLAHHVVALGVLVALATLWIPAAAGVVLAVALALVVGGALVGAFAGAWRLLVAGVAGSALGVLLCAPWTLSWFGASDPSVLLGSALGGVVDLDPGSLLRFETGPIGSSPLSWALLAAGSLALFIGRGWRLAWAARAWAVLLAAWGAVLALGEVAPGSIAPTPEVLLAPAVAALALTAAMSMAAFEADLPGYRFGWRQLASVVAAAGVVLALVPILASTVGGRWELPDRDFNEKLGFVAEERAEDPFLVLWLGEADTVPAAGWELDAPSLTGDATTLVYATTDDAVAGPEQLWAGPASDETTELGDALAFAADGGTSRLGSLLAPMGVRYVVVPEGLAPGSQEVVTEDDALDVELERRPVEAAPDAVAPLVDALARQLDLSSIPVGGDLRVFANAEWSAGDGDGAVSERADATTADRLLTLLTPALWLLALGYLVRTSVKREQGPALTDPAGPPPADPTPPPSPPRPAPELVGTAHAPTAPGGRP